MLCTSCEPSVVRQHRTQHCRLSLLSHAVTELCMPAGCAGVGAVCAGAADVAALAGAAAGAARLQGGCSRQHQWRAAAVQRPSVSVLGEGS